MGWRAHSGNPFKAYASICNTPQPIECGQTIACRNTACTVHIKCHQHRYTALPLSQSLVSKSVTPSVRRRVSFVTAAAELMCYGCIGHPSPKPHAGVAHCIPVPPTCAQPKQHALSPSRTQLLVQQPPLRPPLLHPANKKTCAREQPTRNSGNTNANGQHSQALTMHSDPHDDWLAVAGRCWAISTRTLQPRHQPAHMQLHAGVSAIACLAGPSYAMCHAWPTTPRACCTILCNATHPKSRPQGVTCPYLVYTNRPAKSESKRALQAGIHTQTPQHSQTPQLSHVGPPASSAL